MKINNNELVLMCSCHSLDHMCRLTKQDDGEVDMEVVLNENFGFWTRLRLAIPYLLGKRRCGFGMVASMVVSPEDIQAMGNWLIGDDTANQDSSDKA